MIRFNWLDTRWQGNKGSKLFEELCYELIEYEGFKNLQWRGSSHDKGRDLQADYVSEQPGGTTKTEKWWFQCKRYSSSISLNDIGDAFGYADADNIDFFVIVTSSNLTAPFLDMIESWNAQKYPHKYRIVDWNHKRIEELVKKHKERFSDISKYFEIQRDFDEVLRELKENVEKIEKNLSGEKIIFEKRLVGLKSNKNGLDELFEECIQLASEYDKIKLHGETLNILRSLKIYVSNDFDKNIKLRIKIGETYCKRGWGESGINEFKKALELAEKQNKEETISLLHYKIGIAYHIEQFYQQALPAKFLIDVAKQNLIRYKPFPVI